MEEKRYLVYEAIVKLIKSPVFIIAAILYFAFTVINIVSTLLIINIDDIAICVAAVVSIIPSLILSVGFLLLMIAAFSDNYSPFSTGITFIRVFAIVSVITTIVPTFIQLVSETSGMSRYINKNLLVTSYQIGYFVGLLLPTVLYTVFYLKTFKFADSVRYSAESDIPHPNEGIFMAVFMLVVTAFICINVLGISSILSSAEALSVTVIMKAIIYILLTVLMFMYRNNMKSVTKLQAELKQNQG